MDGLLLAVGEAIGCAMAVALLFVAVLNRLAEVVEHSHTRHLLGIHLVEDVYHLRVAEDGQRLAHRLTTKRCAYLAQHLIESLHRHLSDALQYVVHAVVDFRFAHERLVDHHQSEAFARLAVGILLENEYYLRDVHLCVHVGKVEGIVP